MRERVSKRGAWKYTPNPCSFVLRGRDNRITGGAEHRDVNFGGMVERAGNTLTGGSVPYAGSIVGGTCHHASSVPVEHGEGNAVRMHRRRAGQARPAAVRQVGEQPFRSDAVGRFLP